MWRTIAQAERGEEEETEKEEVEKFKARQRDRVRPELYFNFPSSQYPAVSVAASSNCPASTLALEKLVLSS